MVPWDVSVDKGRKREMSKIHDGYMAPDSPEWQLAAYQPPFPVLERTTTSHM